MSLNVPKFTLAILVLCIAAYAMPGLSALFIYDREAILSGEVWRLWTCHLVHFSFSHLSFNLVVFSIAGTLIESREYRFFKGLYFLMAFFIGITLLIAKPGMTNFGGLSGIASGAIVYFLLLELRYSNPKHTFFCVVLLLSITVKIAIETVTGQFMFASSNELFVPIPLSHSVGSLAALIIFLLQAPSTTANLSLAVK